MDKFFVERLSDFVIKIFFLHIIVNCPVLLGTLLLTGDGTKLAVDELLKGNGDHSYEDESSPEHVCPGGHHSEHDHLEKFTAAFKSN